MDQGRSPTTSYNPSPVLPARFAEAMRARWVQLGNVPSDKLMELWVGMGSVLSGTVLVGAVSVAEKPMELQKWRVLQPPTGTGKTQGACVYAAIVARDNRQLGKGFDRTGILIVTRLIDEADKLAVTINDLAGLNCAVARHSDNPISAEEMARHDVLVVTHRAYANALEDIVQEREDSRLKAFLHWTAGPRFLTIIDESLSDLIKFYQATEEEFRQVAAQFDHAISSEFQWIVTHFQRLAVALTKTVAGFHEFDPDAMTRTGHLWSGGRSDEDWALHRRDIPALRRRMAMLRYDRALLGYDDTAVRRTLAERVDRTLETYEAICSGAAYRSGTAGKLTVHAAKLLLPDALPGPVILDATATQEPIWEVLASRAKITKATEGVRNYQNVTLHVTYGWGVGKTGMIKNGEERLTRLLDNLSDLPASRKVFLCVHKDLEPRVASYETTALELAVDHWGNVDGRNDWQDFDTAVLFGLPYRPNTWSVGLMQVAKQLKKTMEPLSIGSFRNLKQLRAALHTRQITTSVIQAINRIRCRRTVDGQGNCAPADIYIALPRNKVGQEVLTRITEEMPGIVVKDWAFEIDGSKKAVRRAHYAEPVTKLMANHPPGEIDLNAVCEELGLSRAAKKDMQDDFRDVSNPLTAELAEMGVSYHSHGRGRGARSYLLKRRMRAA